MERLQKVLARAGIASRRAAEEIILAGRVRVDGRVVRELGTQVDERRTRVEVDGKTIVAEKLVYVVLHKPRGVVCTLSDPEGRPTIRELLKETGARVVPVGRLDFHTSGALLCTNDGEFAQALAHPKREVPKVYVAKVKGAVDDDALERFGERIVIDGRPTQPAQVKRLRFEGDKTWLEITLREGRNRQVRRLGEATGFPVMRLARISHAGVTSEDLRPGQWRPLTVDELVDLKKVYGVPKKVHAPQFEPAPPVVKGKRRPARPDIHGEIHERKPAQGSRHKRDEARSDPRLARGEGRGSASEARGPRAEARGSRAEARGSASAARPARGEARFSRGETRPERAPSAGRRANRQAPFQDERAPNAGRTSNRKPPYEAERAPSAGRGPNRKPPYQAERAQSTSHSSNRKPPYQGDRAQGTGRNASRKSPFQTERPQSTGGSASRKPPLQSSRGQSPRHDDLTLPWKERSRSAIERRTEKTSARPSADRASKQQGRETSRAQGGSKPNHRSAPTAQNGVRASGPRRGTSR